MFLTAGTLAAISGIRHGFFTRGALPSLWDVCPGWALVSTLARDPGIVVHQMAAQGRDLAHAATLLMTICIKAEQALGLDHGGQIDSVRAQQVNLNAIVVAHLVNVAIGLGVQAPGIQAKYLYGVAELAGHINQDYVLGATKGQGQAAVAGKSLLEKVVGLDWHRIH